MADVAVQAQPIAHGGHFAKGHAGLRHAEGPGVHADEHHALAALGVALQVLLVHVPGVVQRVVHVGDGGREMQRVDGVAQSACGLDQFGGGIGHRWARGE